MRIVLDTNVVVSGLLWLGTPRDTLDALRAGRASAFTSRDLLQEMADVLAREHLSPMLVRLGTSAAFLVQRYALLARTISPAEMNAVLSADPDDDVLIATAVAARAELIISGDHEVLNLKHRYGIAMVNPAEALRRIAAV